MELFCQLTISKKNGIPVAHINGLSSVYPSFDPRTLLSNLSFRRGFHLATKENFNSFDDFDYEKEYAFGKTITVDNRTQYVATVSTILYLMEDSYSTQQPIDLHKIELLKSYLDITFQFTPLKKSLNKWAPYLKNSVTTYELPIHYSHYSISSALKFDVTDLDFYSYNCYSLSDLIYAILHYLALCKYKFNKCPHCGRYFATTTYKQKYCHMGSPYLGYEHLYCEQAVRNILQDLRRLRKRIFYNLYENYYGYEEFQSISKKYINAVKNEPSIQNIDSAYQYISIEKHYTKARK